MFTKSLQSRLIFIFFILLSVIILGIGIMSIIKIEDIYYKGFVEEMMNTVAGFGLNLKNIKLENDKNNLNFSDIQGPKKEKDYKQILEKVYDNFNIYFSINSKSRSGVIIDSNYNDVMTGEKYKLSSAIQECIEQAKKAGKIYASCNDKENDCYWFMCVIREDILEHDENYILVSQSKDYINRQINEIRYIYVGVLFVMAATTLIIIGIIARDITKPIELLTNKAEMIAEGNISYISLPEKRGAGYEISKLIDTFNLMTSQIQNTMNEISTEKSKLETILMHLTDGVLAFNLNGRMVHANLTAKKMLDIKDERSFEEIFKKLKIDINMEKIIYLEDWTSSEEMINVNDKYYNFFFAPFRDEKDRANGVVVVIQDMTKQAKLDDMRKEFVANVSHELKTPITSIKTYSETLLDQEELDEESKRKFLNVILTEANRMTRLVSDLLQLTKFDYKKVAWNRIRFDIKELTKQVCDKHKIQAEKKGQLVECYVTSNVPDVFGDRDGIEQVITNILTNSIKYTPENGNIKVYVGAVHDDAYIKIIDNGIGIPKEDLPRVFERFYRVDKARSREMGGTGLGLPIAKEIIEENGGSIDIKSEVGKGTEVIIKVPTFKEKNSKEK